MIEADSPGAVFLSRQPSAPHQLQKDFLTDVELNVREINLAKHYSFLISLIAVCPRCRDVLKKSII